MLRFFHCLLLAGLFTHVSDLFSQDQIKGRYEMFEVSENDLITNFLRETGGPSFSIEWSGNLQTWYESGEAAEGLSITFSQNIIGTSNGVETVQITAALSGSTLKRVFLRVQIQPDPTAPEGFAYIRAGMFAMGSPAGEATRLANETQHQVTLTRGFFMATTETTWTEWDQVRDWAVDNGYFQLSLSGRSGSIGSTGEGQPVTDLTWYDSIRWCNARSEMEGKTPFYYTSSNFESVFRGGTTSAKVYPDWSANGYRLPTEAEWEYSCRAGTTTPIFTGVISFFEDVPLDPNTNLAGWYAGNSEMSTRPVAGKQPNAWGLYDMHGNVQEFCWDFYLPFTNQTETDPRGLAPDSGKTLRVTRGGSYQGYAQHLRSAHRDSFTGPAASSNFSGFRLAINAGN